MQFTRESRWSVHDTSFLFFLFLFSFIATAIWQKIQASINRLSTTNDPQPANGRSAVNVAWNSTPCLHASTYPLFHSHPIVAYNWVCYTLQVRTLLPSITSYDHQDSRQDSVLPSLTYGLSSPDQRAATTTTTLQRRSTPMANWENADIANLETCLTCQGALMLPFSSDDRYNGIHVIGSFSRPAPERKAFFATIHV